MLTSIIRSPVAGHGLALVAGMLFPLAFAPFDLWIIGIVSLMVLVFSLDIDNGGWTVLRYYLFSLGMYGVGASWIFVSINTYGGASGLLAGMLVALFVTLYSLTGLFAAGLHLLIDKRLRIAVFPAVWVLLEWFRSWFLTGFPWLFAGYGHLETPLAGFAPVTGVLGLSFFCVLTAVLLYSTVLRLLRGDRIAGTLFAKLAGSRWAGVGFVIVIWCAGLLMARIEWAIPFRENVQVSVVQGNIEQHTKWSQSMIHPILNTYLTLTGKEWGREIIVWPEASITLFRESAGSILRALDRRGKEAGSTLVLGIPDRDEAGQFLNTAVSVGEGTGSYIKRRLVPFGEYVPMEDQLRGLITFFDLPMSRNQAGPWDQIPMLAGSLKLSLSICYEVVYAELVRKTVDRPDLFITISNDTWFGHSIGPEQHLQMAAMRALENGRWMIRATNNGITALIDHQGKVQARLSSFEPGVLRGSVSIMKGVTPYHQIGHWPVLVLCFLMIGTGIFWRKKSR